MNVTTALLDTVGTKGKYLVARVNVDHHQTGCDVLPAGTVGVIKGQSPKGKLFVYPHPPGAKRKDKAFSDGQVRIVPWDNLTPIGRVG